MGPISLRPFFLLERPSTIETFYIGRDKRVLLERAMVGVVWRSKINLGARLASDRVI